MHGAYITAELEELAGLEGTRWDDIQKLKLDHSIILLERESEMQSQSCKCLPKTEQITLGLGNFWKTAAS